MSVCCHDFRTLVFLQLGPNWADVSAQRLVYPYLCECNLRRDFNCLQRLVEQNVLFIFLLLVFDVPAALLEYVRNLLVGFVECFKVVVKHKINESVCCGCLHSVYFSHMKQRSSLQLSVTTDHDWVDSGNRHLEMTSTDNGPVPMVTTSMQWRLGSFAVGSKARGGNEEVR